MHHRDDDTSEVRALEAELRGLSRQLIAPRQGECLPCYLLRMTAFGCRGHELTEHWRERSAPRATRLRRMLADMGACCCACQVFDCVYDVRGAFVPVFREHERLGCPEPPPCRGVRLGSVQPCIYWERKLFCEEHRPRPCW